MAVKSDPRSEGPEPSIYAIRLKGHLSDHWAEWFEGLSITLEEDGHTVLTGPVRDDAALHGLLKRVRDSGMPLLSVNRLDPDQKNADSVV